MEWTTRGTAAGEPQPCGMAHVFRRATRTGVEAPSSTTAGPRPDPAIATTTTAPVRTRAVRGSRSPQELIGGARWAPPTSARRTSSSRRRSVAVRSLVTRVLLSDSLNLELHDRWLTRAHVFALTLTCQASTSTVTRASQWRCRAVRRSSCAN